jgi:integrase
MGRRPQRKRRRYPHSKPSHRDSSTVTRGRTVTSRVVFASIQSILRWHLVPTLGPRCLDAITNEQVQRLKLALSERAPKTVNNVLTVLSTLLKKAVEWGELERLPCVIKLLPNPKKTMGFHDFDQYERLLMVARKRGPDAYLMVLAGGDAGLRLGEIIAREWCDIDMAARRLTVERSDWL